MTRTDIVALQLAGNSRGSPFWPSRISFQAVTNSQLVRYLVAGNDDRTAIARW